jgi:hypothetical protein
MFVANQPRFDAREMLDAIAANGVTTLCAAHRVAHVRAGRTEDMEGKFAPGVFRRRAV